RLVAETVAAALDLSTGNTRTAEEALIAYLRPRQTLLVLDNCEHVLPALADLVARVLDHCPAVQVLATSRAPVRIQGEQRLLVPPLVVPPPGVADLACVAAAAAVELFVQRARSVNASFVLTKQ